MVEDDLEDEESNITQLVPALAERYEVSPDGQIYTFSLRKNVRFHDGTRFDARAVKYNLDRLWRADAPHFYDVAADYNQLALQALKDVQVLDAYTVRLVLHEPFPEFLRCMTQEDAPGSVVMLSPSALQAHGNGMAGDRATGTGPFRLLERFDTPHGSGVRVIRNDDYWGGAPYLDGIEFIPLPDAGARAEALLTGDVDLAYGPDSTRLGELRAQNFVVREGPIPYVWYFIFNTRDPHLRDARVRQAIAYAFDRHKVSQAFDGATAIANGILPPASPAYEPDFPEFYPYDPDRASTLLAEAGLSDGFAFKLVTAAGGSGQVEPLKICEQLKRDLSAVGITVDIEPRHDWVSYCEEWRRGMPQGVGLSEMSWGMSCDAWIEQVAHSRYSSPAGFNAGYFSSREIDRLLDLARTERANDRRIELYRVVHRLMMVELPLLPVLTLREGSVVHSLHVKNFRFPRQNWQDFKRVWIDRQADGDATHRQR